MITTIEIPSELAARLTAAGISSDEVTERAIHALTDFLLEAEQDATESWWDSLSVEERAAEKAKTQTSLKAGDAGRTSPASEVYTRLRQKYSRNKQVGQESPS